MPRHEGIWRGLHKIQYAYTTNVGPPTEQETCHASENKKNAFNFHSIRMWGDAGSAVLMPSPHKHLVSTYKCQS